MTEQLKPCPFCGDKAKYYLAGNESLGYQPGVTCIKCLANVHGRFVEPSELGQEAEDVINRWNRRTEPERKVDPWIPASERLPEKGVPVLVYTPPCHGQEEGNINLDLIDPSSDGDVWLIHSESYEHYCAVSDGINCTGPDETAPYTHWMPLPAAPKEQSE